MVNKAFFQERTPAQIRSLDLREVHRARGLVDKILALGPDQGLLIRQWIMPGRFGVNNPPVAARKAYKHGPYVVLPQAETLAETLDDKREPHELRKEAFDNYFSVRKEEEVEALGYSFRPVQGRDKTKRVVPFVWIMEGARIFTYAMQHAGGIDVKPFVDAERVGIEGANIVVSVPSREEKKLRYGIRFNGVPVVDNREKRAIWTTFDTTYAEGRVPEHSLWSFGYRFASDKEQSRTLIFYPHDVAGMLGVAKHFMTTKDNSVPWDMNPFAKPSLLAAKFYRNLCNNVLMADNKVSGKEKTRKLYVPEKSILLSRLVATHGHDNTMFWKAGRDPRLQDYDWNMPK